MALAHMGPLTGPGLGLALAWPPGSYLGPKAGTALVALLLQGGGMGPVLMG